KLLAPVAVVVLLAPAVTAPGLASLQQKGLLTPSAAPARVKGLLDQIQELFKKGDTQRPDVTTPPGARAGDSVIWGRITDTRGRPMQNATVRIEGDSMAGESIFLSPEPDEDGEYAIHDVPRGNYRVKAWADVNYRGHQWTLPLHPTDNSNAFVSPSVRKDFRWRLSGFMPRGMPDNFLSYYGCAISVRKG